MHVAVDVSSVAAVLHLVVFGDGDGHGDFLDGDFVDDAGGGVG